MPNFLFVASLDLTFISKYSPQNILPKFLPQKGDFGQNLRTWSRGGKLFFSQFFMLSSFIARRKLSNDTSFTTRFNFWTWKFFKKVPKTGVKKCQKHLFFKKCKKGQNSSFCSFWLFSSFSKKKAKISIFPYFWLFQNFQNFQFFRPFFWKKIKDFSISKKNIFLHCFHTKIRDFQNFQY